MTCSRHSRLVSVDPLLNAESDVVIGDVIE